MITEQNIKDRFCAIIKENNIPLELLAEQLEIPYFEVFEYANGQKIPPAYLIAKFAFLLHVDLNYLFCEDLLLPMEKMASLYIKADFQAKQNTK